ncbi:MAG: hypothetical protein EPN49_12480 [Rhodanobacter sp.]|nr:MAG: hypothetical protein EPN49_12480 [Rhodanobacter sp.]
MTFLTRSKAFAALPWGALLLALALPGNAIACACGCGLFEVGTGGQLPTTTQSGTTLFAQFAYLDQNHNWSGSSSAPAAANNDKDIRTLFQTVGLETQFNRSWGMRIEVPYWQRHFSTTDEDTGKPATFNHGALGDIRVTATYTGFSGDRSTGLQFGIKLPTGDWTYRGFDRDTEIGTGTTDLIIGGFHRWNFGANLGWSGFVQGTALLPANTRAGYRPGDELDASAGIYPAGWKVGTRAHLTPILQALLAWRSPDSGVNADPPNTGLARILLAPGLELQWQRLRLDASVAKPVYQRVHGNQLIGQWQASMSVSYAL